jgi:sugar O-acyltransferase (sialic acid O-acetyltransferase NeuD family)
MNLYGIFGAGGFGTEVIPLAKAMLKSQLTSSDFELVFIDENKKISNVNQYVVMTIDEFFSHPATTKFFNVTIANHENRKKIAELMVSRGAHPFRVNAHNSIELDDNIIGEGAIFCPFTTVTSNTKIGKYFHANIYSYIAHDCVIGDYVTFAPDVHCNGNILIENNVYVGTGVILKQGKSDNPLVIGEGAILGMGAVVTKNVLPYETVVGNPAKPFHRGGAVDLVMQTTHHDKK